jgi:hypothetical protein
MGLSESARKLRRAAERPRGRKAKSDPDADATARRKADAESAEAHLELTRPEHSKGRPPAEDEARPRAKRRASNAGNDGP